MHNFVLLFWDNTSVIITTYINIQNLFLSVDKLWNNIKIKFVRGEISPVMAFKDWSWISFTIYHCIFHFYYIFISTTAIIVNYTR